jgi:uncharacterized oxidoreductase
MMALEQNMIGVLFANSDISVAPWGGRRPMLGTNPVSFAIPAGKEKPIVVDYATAAVAEGKIRAAFLRGDKIPDGWILDKDGKPSTNPADLFEPPLPPVQVKIAGAQLPMAGHKGFGLGLVVDILGGALTGAGCDGDVKMGNGVFLEAINVDSFIPLKNYQATVDKLIRDIKASPKAPGVTEILMPGEPELKAAEKRSRDGIPIPDATWAGIVNVAKELRVDLDKVLKSTV